VYVLGRKPGDGNMSMTGMTLTSADFDAALASARSSHSASIGAPNIPSVSWDDVGGLENVKSDILDTIQLPLEHPELFAEGLKKRSGG
jgi:peroxin-6